jgi:predicted acylesterase/phospholipase RssA
MSPVSPDLQPCDLVLKGGVTSGVIYPTLIARLAQRFRFRSVGGTSAGAIAAAACAAAEFRRSESETGRQADADRDAGFHALEGLPGTLSEAVGPEDELMLQQLFQPRPWLRAHLRVLIALTGSQAWWHKAAWIFPRALLRRFWGLTGAVWLWHLAPVGSAWLAPPVARSGDASTGALNGAAAVLAPVAAAAPPGWSALAAEFALATAAAFPWALGLALVWWLAGLGWALTRGGWGLCSGRSDDPRAGTPGLTDWLHRYLQDLAGLPDPARPLCFRDLWAGHLRAAHGPTGDFDADTQIEPPPEWAGPAARVIDLQVMTTAVSQSMSYAIPWREDAPAFFYDPEAWSRLFPPEVMDWLVRHEPLSVGARAVVDAATRRPLRALPDSADLPVVVAVRLSLSFPLLLAAVPLHAVDRSDGPDERAGELAAKRIWFSDGGLSSNMPLHFFDALLPGHPTFAINLKGEHPRHPIETGLPAGHVDNGRIYLPRRSQDGRHRWWPTALDHGVRGLLAFLGGMLDTMQAWRDEIQFPSPGHRDRIVQISLRGDEGGLNLDMPPARVEALAEAGWAAGDRLIEAFLDQPADPAVPDGWEAHRRIRLRNFLAHMSRLLQDEGLQDPGWEALLPALSQHGYTAADIDAARTLMQGLRALGDGLQALPEPRVLEAKAPRHAGRLRVTPVI